MMRLVHSVVTKPSLMRRLRGTISAKTPDLKNDKVPTTFIGRLKIIVSGTILVLFTATLGLAWLWALGILYDFIVRGR